MTSGSPRASETLRVGIVGAGFVAQVVHLPHLIDARGRFRVVALAEPDARVRERVADRFGVPASFPSHEQMLQAGGLDAVLVCSPNHTHADVVVDALRAGCHVLVEKPMCLSGADADRVIAARDDTRLVVQVAYMKRFDPAYEALIEDLAGAGDELAYVSTVTVDPGLARHFGPYVAPAPAPPGEERDRLLSDAFMGALVHDVNAVHGILDALGVPYRAASVADGFGRRDGSLAGGTAVLPDGLRWSMTWALLPSAATFDERIELLGSNGVRRLEFPAPYLVRAPTPYSWVSRRGGGAQERTFRSWGDSYGRQLDAFHGCVTDGRSCRTPPEQARADVALLAALHEATLAAV